MQIKFLFKQSPVSWLLPLSLSLAAWDQATFSLNRPSHPSPEAGTGWHVLTFSFLFYSILFYFILFYLFSSHIPCPLLFFSKGQPNIYDSMSQLSFTEMIFSCQNVLEEVCPPVSLSPKAVAECILTLCDPKQCKGVVRALGRRNYLAQLPAMKVSR